MLYLVDIAKDGSTFIAQDHELIYDADTLNLGDEVTVMWRKTGKGRSAKTETYKGVVLKMDDNFDVLKKEQDILHKKKLSQPEQKTRQPKKYKELTSEEKSGCKRKASSDSTSSDDSGLLDMIKRKENQKPCSSIYSSDEDLHKEENKSSADSLASKAGPSSNSKGGPKNFQTVRDSNLTQTLDKMECMEPKNSPSKEELKKLLAQRDEEYSKRMESLLEKFKRKKKKSHKEKKDKKDGIPRQKKEVLERSNSSVDVHEENPSGNTNTVPEESKKQLSAAEESQREQLPAAEESQQEQLPAAEESQREQLPAAEESQQKQLSAAEKSQQEQLSAAEESPKQLSAATAGSIFNFDSKCDNVHAIAPGVYITKTLHDYCYDKAHRKLNSETKVARAVLTSVFSAEALATHSLGLAAGRKRKKGDDRPGFPQHAVAAILSYASEVATHRGWVRENPSLIKHSLSTKLSEQRNSGPRRSLGAEEHY